MIAEASLPRVYRTGMASMDSERTVWEITDGIQTASISIPPPSISSGNYEFASKRKAHRHSIPTQVDHALTSGESQPRIPAAHC